MTPEQLEELKLGYLVEARLPHYGPHYGHVIAISEEEAVKKPYLVSVGPGHIFWCSRKQLKRIPPSNKYPYSGYGDWNEERVRHPYD